jgi:hypothetical protein
MTISGHQTSVSALLAVRSSSKLSHRPPGYPPIARTRLAKPTRIAFHVGSRGWKCGAGVGADSVWVPAVLQRPPEESGLPGIEDSDGNLSSEVCIFLVSGVPCAALRP